METLLVEKLKKEIKTSEDKIKTTSKTVNYLLILLKLFFWLSVIFLVFTVIFAFCPSSEVISLHLTIATTAMLVSLGTTALFYLLFVVYGSELLAEDSHNKQLVRDLNKIETIASNNS